MSRIQKEQYQVSGKSNEKDLERAIPRIYIGQQKIYSSDGLSFLSFTKALRVTEQTEPMVVEQVISGVRMRNGKMCLWC